MNCVFPYDNIKSVKKNSNKHMLWRNIFSTDFLKVGLLVSTLCTSLLIYIITVNISSTEWYYYDQVRKQQEKTNFNYNIVKLNTLTLQSDLRSTINFNPLLKKDSIQYLEVSQ